MALSNRTKEIVLLLLQQRSCMTVNDVAKQLNISRRTVYREVAEITEIVGEFNIQLESVPKEGLRLCGNKKNMNNLRKYIESTERIILVDQEERGDYILLYLLCQRDYVKTEAIALDTQCALSTTRSDLTKIGEKLKSYELKFIQKKGIGNYIEGSRIEKNQCIASLLLNRVDENILCQYLEGKEESVNPFLIWMSTYGFGGIIQKTHEILKKVFLENENRNNNIKTREYIEAILLLAFLLYYHGTEQEYKDYMKTDMQQEEAEALFMHVMKQIKEKMNISLSENEISYIQWVIQITAGREHRLILSIRSQRLNEDILAFIEYMEQRMGISFGRDKDLMDGLYIHMSKALVRIRSNMQIENPALREIKTNYGEIFRTITEGLRICFKKDYFPEDEIGYIVLYFATALDKLTKRIFRVVVVCSGGMGSSKALAYNLERKIPELKVEKTMSVVALEQEELDRYDLILSTIPLYRNDENCLQVSVMLSEKEIQQIREKVKRHKYSQLIRISAEQKRRGRLQGKSVLESLENVNKVSKMALEVIKNLQVIHYNESKGICQDLKDLLLDMDVIEKYESIDRESYFMLPMSRCAYYDGVCEALIYPMIQVLVYDKPGTLENSEEQFQAVIALLYNNRMGKAEKEAFRYIVESVISDSQVSNTICIGNDNSIREWIGYYFQTYLHEMINDL